MRSVESFSPNVIDSGKQDTNNLYRDPYNIGIKNISEFETLDTVTQLSLLSTITEAANADTWYAVGEAKRLFDDISGSDRFSPLIRIIASCAKLTNPNGDSSEYLMEQEDHIDKQCGYNSIVLPGSFPMNGDYESLSEQELESRLKHFKDGDAIIPEVYYDDLSYYYDLESELQQRIFDSNQKNLHQEFPALPENKQLVKIASNAAASVIFRIYDDDFDDRLPICNSLGVISDLTGHTASVTESDNSLGLGMDSIQYLNAVHKNSIVKHSVEDRLGLKLTDITLDAQVQLLKYMAEAGDTRFDSLCSTLHNTKPELRLKLAEGFLAADFGEDFGDALLTIANSERISDESLEKILDQIDSCRKSISLITDLFKEIDDGQFTREFARAANERLTDAIAVFKDISQNGRAKAELGWVGEVEFDYDSAMEALEYETKSLEMISGVISDLRDGKEGVYAERFLSPDESHERSYYHLYSPNYGHVLLKTRSEGASVFNNMLEYGKQRSRYNEQASNVGVEAQISFIVNPVAPFALPNPFKPDRRKPYDSDRQHDSGSTNNVSAIRLDREGHREDRKIASPINDQGTVATDLAAINDRTDTPSGKIARLFSVGNALRHVGESDSSLNHNTRWFTQDTQIDPTTGESTGGYGTAAGFKRIVDYFNSNINALCAIHQPGPGEGILAAMKRERNARRGRSVFGATNPIDGRAA